MARRSSKVPRKRLAKVVDPVSRTPRSPRESKALAERHIEDARIATEASETTDVRVEPGSILVKTHSLDAQLDGFVGYRYPVSGRGKLGSADRVIYNEPSPCEVLTWSRTVGPGHLRSILRAAGVECRNLNFLTLSWRLITMYELLWRDRNAQPLAPAQRERRFRRLDLLDDLLRRESLSDDEVIYAWEHMEHGHDPAHSEGRLRMAKHGEEVARRTPSEIMKQLEEQASEDEAEHLIEDAPAARSEVEAIKAGKRTKAKSTAKPAPAKSEQAETKEEEDVKLINGGKKNGKEQLAKSRAAIGKDAKKAKSEKPAKKAAPVGDVQKLFPLGSKVKYIGRNEKYNGRTAEITGYRGTGVTLKFSDGAKGSAAPTGVELLEKGKKSA